MALTYTKRLLIERIRKHLANGFPKSEFPITINEMLLYIDEAVPVVMKALIFENAKVTGVMDVPEAYLVTYNFTITNQNVNTYEWYITLPQPPLALPNGYNITDSYFANKTNGQGKSLFFVNAKSTSYRKYMPMPFGVSARVEGSIIYMKSHDGSPLLNEQIFIQLPVSRTASIDDIMNIPDDAISGIFDIVVMKILKRFQIPIDEIKDNLPAGQKPS